VTPTDGRVCLLLALTCAGPTTPAGEPFMPPPAFAVWYAQLWDECGSGVVPRPAYPYPVLRFQVADLPPHVLGRWDGPVITLARGLEMWPPGVKHEMLHAQLGRPGHPPIFASCFFLRY